MILQTKIKSYLKRKRRSNAKVKAQSPDFRCIVNRSVKHIRAQLIDAKGYVIATASDLSITKWTKIEKAFEVGKILAKIALDKKITSCVFDRNGFLYHGRVKSLCEGLREAGIVV